MTSSPGAGAGEPTSVLIHCAVQSSDEECHGPKLLGALQADSFPSASHTRTSIRSASGFQWLAGILNVDRLI